jgi:hypothetical protein
MSPVAKQLLAFQEGFNAMLLSISSEWRQILQQVLWGKLFFRLNNISNAWRRIIDTGISLSHLRDVTTYQYTSQSRRYESPTVAVCDGVLRKVKVCRLEATRIVCQRKRVFLTSPPQIHHAQEWRMSRVTLIQNNVQVYFKLSRSFLNLHKDFRNDDPADRHQVS